MQPNFTLILCTPRTGSSLVAQIFWRHGCWVDKETENYVNPFGYTSYENQPLKRKVKQEWFNYKNTTPDHWGRLMNATDKHKANVRNAVDQLIPNNKSWMFKTIPEYYPMFEQFDPRIVLVRRDEDKTIESLAAKQKARGIPVDETEIRTVYHDRMKVMEQIKQNNNGVWVSTDDVIAGDYTEIREALIHCGIEPSDDLITQSVDPDKWHYNAK